MALINNLGTVYHQYCSSSESIEANWYIMYMMVTWGWEGVGGWEKGQHIEEEFNANMSRAVN